MKQFYLLACALLCTATLRAEDAPIRGPRIACDEPVFDFGVADNRTTVEHTFILKNTGDTTLEIVNTRAACGCTVANVSTKTIPPGGTSELTSRLNLQGRNGPQSKTITITSNDPEKPDFVVTINGTATQSVQVSPDRLMFGQIQAGQEISLPVDLQFLSGEAVEIQGIETTDDHVRVETEEIEQGRKIRLKVNMKAGLKPGANNSVIRVRTTSPERPLIEIPVFADIAGELNYAPREMVLSPDARTVTRYIVIRAGAAGSVDITNVSLPDPAMTYTILPFGGQGHRIQIDNITARPELNGRAIVIATSSPSLPQIEIPFRVGP